MTRGYRRRWVLAAFLCACGETTPTAATTDAEIGRADVQLDAGSERDGSAVEIPDGGTGVDASTITSDATSSRDAAMDSGGQCPRTSGAIRVGTVINTSLNEGSGLVASRANAGVYWSHNDSGHNGRIFGLEKNGTDRAEITLQSVRPDDAEDIGLQRRPGTTDDYLILGDIGDNERERTSVTLFVVREPTVSSAFTTTTEGAEEVRVAYPDGAHNAEALIAMPDGRDVYIVTKVIATHAAVYVVEDIWTGLAPGTPITRVARLVADVPVAIVTGASASHDGRRVLIRSYSAEALLLDVSGGITGALHGCVVPVAFEDQGEAIAFAADGNSYLSFSEGATQAISEVTFSQPD